MKKIILIASFVLIFGCDAFKIEKMGGEGQSCFENQQCVEPYICIEGICEKDGVDDDIGTDDKYEKGDDISGEEEDDDDDTGESPDKDLIIDTPECNKGEICWKIVPTQQTRCFSETGSVTCQKPGENLYGQDGVYAPSAGRGFQNIYIGDKNFVWDPLTEILWYKTSSENELSYSEAESFCEVLNDRNEGEKDNWRLPSFHELVSIVHFDVALNEPMVDGFYFPFIKAEKYWTGTSLGQGKNRHYVDFSGRDQFYVSDSEVRSHYTVCVSSDHEYDNDRRLDRWKETNIDTDTVVKDLLTGFVWLKTPNYTSFLWEEALHYCENLVYAGFNDWRLPNVNELQSLATYGKNYEHQTTFPGMGTPFLWSSTTNANDIKNAWVVELKYGILKPELSKDKNQNLIYTTCIRDDQVL